MKKLSLIFAIFLVSNIHSQELSKSKALYKIGKVVVDELPEKLYVSGTELSEIKADAILLRPDVKKID